MKAREMRETKQLLTIDISNAFGSLPWNVIQDKLRLHNIPLNLI